MTIVRATATTVLVLAPLLNAWADAPPPPQDVWTGTGQAGYVSSQGNSEGKSANAAIDMSFLDDPWKHAFHLAGLYGQSANVVSAERWDTLWQSNYNLTKNLFTFGALHYQRDMFSGFQYQANVSVGVGYNLINTDKTQLSTQVGVGYGKLRPEDLTTNPNGSITRTLEPSESSAIGTFGVTYSQKLTGTTTLSDKLLVESGSINTVTTNALALAVKVSTKLALSVAYSLQDNTSPPAGLKKVDTQETINLVYSF
jgi:putative salt-induced outer membrane protein